VSALSSTTRILCGIGFHEYNPKTGVKASGWFVCEDFIRNGTTRQTAYEIKLQPRNKRHHFQFFAACSDSMLDRKAVGRDQKTPTQRKP
jgi:hypothetical protein